MNPLQPIQKYLNYIDSGKLYKQPFYIIYALFAILHAIFPIAIIIGAQEYGELLSLSDGNLELIWAFWAIWLVVVVVCIIGFAIWWHRKEQVKEITSESDDFVAVPAVAHLIKTFGEWFGTCFAILGFLFVILGRLFLGDNLNILSNILGIDFLGNGLLDAFLAPLIGFGWIVQSRVIAEILSSFPIIANNTKRNQNLKGTSVLPEEKEQHNTPPINIDKNDLFK